MTASESRLPEPAGPSRKSSAARLQGLEELTELLDRTPCGEDLLQEALEILKGPLGTLGLAILTLAPSGRMHACVHQGFSAAFLAAHAGVSPWPVNEPITGPVLVEDTATDPSMPRCEGIGSLAFIPLLDQGRLMGELLLGHANPHAIAGEDLRFAVTAGRLLGFALGRTRREQSMANALSFSERLLENANVLVVGLDQEGRIEIFNGAAEQTTGYRKEEVLGRNWFELVVPREHYPSVWSYFKQLLVSGQLPYEFENPLLTRTGEERLISWRNSFLKEPGSRVVTLSFGMDITDLRRSSEALRASEERFSKIFHLSPDAIDLTRVEDGVSLDCNRSYEKLSGYSRAEILGHTTLPGDLGIWIRKEDRDRHIAELRARGEVFGLEAELRRKDGSSYVAMLSSSLLELNGQHCNLTLTRDITEAKRAEEALRNSEEKFAKTFRLSPDAININRLEDGVYLDVNKGFMDITGYRAEEVIGRSSLPGDLSIWVNREDRDRMLATLLDKGEVTGLEAPFRRKDGTVLFGLMSARIIDLEGERCVLSITREITERKRAEEALREGAQRLQLALASGNLGIWDRNLLDDTEVWDDRMYDLYGLQKGSLVPNYGTWLHRIVHPEDAFWIPAAVQAALTGQRSYDLRFRILLPDGAVRHIRSNGVVIRDAGGRAVRIIGINRDRTEQVEAEAERRRLQAEVHHAEKLESIGSLAGGVAHDMNNVLTAILIMAEVLRGKYAEDAAEVKSLETILHACRRGRDLVAALTDFARKGLEESVFVDLNEVLRQEVDLLRRTTLKKVQVVLELEDGLPTIRGSVSELGSAVMNLSVNALDAMPNGGTLTFCTRTQDAGWVELSVTDTGTGMSQEVMTKAMEPFFTTKPKGKGTGLGLARVYGTVRAHGGTLELQSQPGAGTKVLLHLPIGAGEGILEASPEASPEGPVRSLRILLVDDELIILDTISAVLESMGHEVATASSGEEALHRLEEGFDLVILDHNMPGLTGAQTLIRLRSRRPDLPVILSTGYLDAKTEDLLASIPHVWVLKKPYRKRDMQRTLGDIFDLRGGH